MKKGQSISINTIVVAAIALIVLVVVIAIFANKILNVNTEFSNCLTLGGTCQADVCNPDTQKEQYSTNCERKDPPEHCCILLLNIGE